MKKILAAALAAVMLLSLIAVPVFADGKPRFYLTGPSSAKVGDKVSVTLNVEGKYSAHIINLMVYFDNTSFKYQGKKYGEAYSDSIDEGGFGLCDITEKGNAVSLGIMMVSDPTSAEGELVDLIFEVLPTASASADFTISVQMFAYMPVGQTTADDIDYTADGITVKLSGGTGTTTTPMPSPGGWTSPTKAPAATGSQEPASTPKPGSSETAPSGTEPGQTDNCGNDPGSSEPAGSEPAGSEGPSEAPGTTDNGEAGDPSADPSAEATENGSAAASEQPGNEGTPTKNSSKRAVPFIIGGCALAALLAAAVVVVIKKASGNNK